MFHCFCFLVFIFFSFKTTLKAGQHRSTSHAKGLLPKIHHPYDPSQRQEKAPGHFGHIYQPLATSSFSFKLNKLCIFSVPLTPKLPLVTKPSRIKNTPACYPIPSTSSLLPFLFFPSRMSGLIMNTMCIYLQTYWKIKTELEGKIKIELPIRKIEGGREEKNPRVKRSITSTPSSSPFPTQKKGLN